MTGADVLPFWPDRARFFAWLRFNAIFCAAFLPAYFGAIALAERAPHRYGLFAAWETAIPLVPAMILPYLTLPQVFLLPLFHLSEGEMARLTRQSLAVLATAFCIFVVVPGRLGFPAEAIEGTFAPLFALLHQIDSPTNTVPSLHVAFAALILLQCAARAIPAAALAYRFWLALLCLSTVLTHQHHIADVAAGLLLALVARRFIPLSAAR